MPYKDDEDLSQQIRREKQQLKKQYGELYDVLTGVFFRHDPMSLNWETNTDEYEPEVRAILPRLREAGTVEELRSILTEEFTRMFTATWRKPSQTLSARCQERLDAAAEEIWKLWTAWLKEGGEGAMHEMQGHS